MELSFMLHSGMSWNITFWLNVSEKDKLIFDLAAREVICDSFKGELKGKNMFPAWMYSPGGNGVALDLEINDDKTQVISEIYSYKRNFITNGMTRFENKLGGKVVVMGMTLGNNHSQSLFNYRRKYIIQNLIKWCSDEYCYVENAPDVVLIENVSKSQKDFKEMLTLINFCEDELEEIAIHIPATLSNMSEIYLLDYDGNWKIANFELKNNSILIPYKLKSCDPVFVLIK